MGPLVELTVCDMADNLLIFILISHKSRCHILGFFLDW